LCYLTLSSIVSIQKQGTVLIIDENSMGKILLQFITEYDSFQAFSLINYVLENQDVVIADISPINDDILPIIYFNSLVSFNGATAGPYDTSFGLTFSANVTLPSPTASFTQGDLIYILINNVYDARDHIIELSDSSLNIGIISAGGLTGGVTGIISSTGSYNITFSVSDLAGNSVDPKTNLNLTVL
jgi:hypothetical protein